MKRFFCIITLAFASILFISGGLSQPSKYEGKIVRKVDFYGLNNTNQYDLLDVMRTTVGYPLKAFEVRQDIKDVFQKGKFESLVVEIEEYKDGVRLKFICKERPLVKSIEIKGMDEFVDSELEDIIKLKEGEVYRKDYLEKSIKQLKAKYDSEGLFNAVIKYKVIPVEKENLVDVQIIIDEGEEIKIRKISFLGTKNLCPKELLDEMETEEDSLFQDGPFNRGVYEQDKSKVIAYYKDKGYINAQIIEDKVEYEWDDPQTKEERVIFIVIKIAEGEKFYFDKYTVKVTGKDGKTVFNPEDFQKDFQLKESGKIFNYTEFQKDLQGISYKYASKGYIYARVIPKKTITEKEVEEEGVKEKRKFVRIDFEISEGEKAYIEAIIIKGNKKTKDKVIRREIIVKEGELFNSRKIQLSREKVYNLGYFKQVNFDLRPGSREGHMNLIVDVEEQPSGTISLGGGYGTTTGFSIFADLAENNLFGNGQRVGLKFEYGPLKSSITLSFYERWLLDYPIGFEVSIFYHLYTIETGSMFANSIEMAEYQKQAFGYSFGLSYRFWYYYTVGSVWSQAFKSYLNPSGNCTDEVFVYVSHGLQLKNTQSIYLVRNSKDNYLNPTSGSKIGFTISFTGGFLGGDDHFMKLSPEIYFYFSPFHLPFLKTHPCVFELRANGSFLVKPMGSNRIQDRKPHQTNKWLESEDRLHIGGPETIRGWNYFDFSLPTSWRYVGLYHRILYGLEFRIPVHPQMLWITFFFDAGSLWSDRFWEGHLSESYLESIENDLENDELYRITDFFKRDTKLLAYFRYSYGFGFKIQIPMMPLRFWFGRRMIFDDSKKSFRSIGGLNFQFSIGDMRF